MNELKELQKQMLQVAKDNNLGVYLMTEETYNSIVNKIHYLDAELKSSRTGRDNWKKKYYEAKTNTS